MSRVADDFEEPLAVEDLVDLDLLVVSDIAEDIDTVEEARVVDFAADQR